MMSGERSLRALNPVAWVPVQLSSQYLCLKCNTSCFGGLLGGLNEEILVGLQLFLTHYGDPVLVLVVVTYRDTFEYLCFR